MVGVVQKFVAALAELEQGGNPDPLVLLFSEDCELRNPLSSSPTVGRPGAKIFFERYRASFDAICSTYRAIICGEGQAALEWATTGKTHTGEPFLYRGVTILDFAGTRISRLCAYFDPSELEALIPAGTGHASTAQPAELH